MKAILQTKQLGTSVQNYDYLLPKNIHRNAILKWYMTYIFLTRTYPKKKYRTLAFCVVVAFHIYDLQHAQSIKYSGNSTECLNEIFSI